MFAVCLSNFIAGDKRCLMWPTFSINFGGDGGLLESSAPKCLVEKGRRSKPKLFRWQPVLAFLRRQARQT